MRTDGRRGAWVRGGREGGGKIERRQERKYCLEGRGGRGERERERESGGGDGEKNCPCVCV